MAPPLARGLLLVDHGSRSAEANQTLEAIAALVRERVGEDTIVGAAHMELASPSIVEGVDALVLAGVAELVVMPYFLAPGRHSTVDVPKLVAEAMQGHPAVPFRITEPLGVHALLAELVIARVVESER